MRPCPKPTKQDDERRRRAARAAGRAAICREEPGEKVCWLCGRNGCADPLDRHHVWGGAMRRKSEAYGAAVYLCHDRCHENGPEAVHRCAETADKLHREYQKRIMATQGWTAEEFRLEFGRSYL